MTSTVMVFRALGDNPVTHFWIRFVVVSRHPAWVSRSLRTPPGTFGSVIVMIDPTLKVVEVNWEGVMVEPAWI